MVINTSIENKFYTAKSDRAFKEIFLSVANQDLLITLLESILHLDINKISYENIERNQGNIKVRRKNLDILLDTNQGLIGIEVNAYSNEYLNVRNFAFLCDMYSHYTLVGEDYSEDVEIIQIDISYDIGSKSKRLIRKYLIQDDEGEFVKNFKIIELNMDNIMKFWYSKNEKKINEFKYLIMLDLGLEDLKYLSKEDKLVNKFMEDLKKLNKDPKFREYMSFEEDIRKCHNSEIKIARKNANIETAKKLLGLGILTDEQIESSTEVPLEEIKKLKENLN